MLTKRRVQGNAKGGHGRGEKYRSQLLIGGSATKRTRKGRKRREKGEEERWQVVGEGGEKKAISRFLAEPRTIVDEFPLRPRDTLFLPFPVGERTAVPRIVDVSR